MDMMLLTLMMAVTVEGLIEYIKTFGRAVLAKQWKTAATQGCALALGIALCTAVGADFYGALGVTFALPWAGSLLTGIFASRGSNYLSDLIARLRALGGPQPAADTPPAAAQP